jgi:hypothetical protein
MMQLQLVSGMRPGGVVQMRACNIDMSGKIWEYRRCSHRAAFVASDFGGDGGRTAGASNPTDPVLTHWRVIERTAGASTAHVGL